MADICAICGRKVVRTSSNCILKDGCFIHKKCPKPKVLNTSDKEDYNSLRDKLSHYATTCPRGYLEGKTMNFARAMQVVKKIHDDGYSYTEIEYALDKVVEEQNGFWGIKAVENRIDVIIARKHVQDKKKEKLKEQMNEVEYKDTYKEVDLSKLCERDNEW